MLAFARDLPNLCSLTGLLAALFGLYFAVRGVYPAALIALLWRSSSTGATAALREP